MERYGIQPLIHHFRIEAAFQYHYQQPLFHRKPLREKKIKHTASEVVD